MMAYAWRSFGWFLGGVAVALGLLLVPLQVAAERKKLDKTVEQIAQAKRDIRALETEFDTRANLAQLEQWNGDTLGLVAPQAGQFVADEAALASIDLHGGMTGQVPGQAEVKTAALIVPSLPNPVIYAAPAPTATAEPSVAGAIADVRTAAVTRSKAQAVAMLDRQLLSDSTIGDLLSGAHAETGLRR